MRRVSQIQVAQVPGGRYVAKAKHNPNSRPIYTRPYPTYRDAYRAAMANLTAPIPPANPPRVHCVGVSQGRF